MKADWLKSVVREGKEAIEYQLQPNETLDGVVLKRLKAGEIPGILRMGACFENGHNYMYAYTDQQETLFNRLSDVVTEELILRSFQSIVQTLIRIEEEGINPAYIVLDSRYIYINREQEKAELICMPGKNATINMDEIPDFFRTILANAVYLNSENGNYVAKLLSAINQEFDLKSFLRQINGLMMDAGIRYEEEPVPSPEPISVEPVVTAVEEPVPSPEPIPVEPVVTAVEEPVPSPEPIPVEPVVTAVEEPVPAPQPTPVTPIATAVEQPQPRPMIMPQDASAQKRMMTPEPHLIRVRTGEKIAIPDGDFVIGKSVAEVNYAVVGNPAVSRIHCTISKKNGVYYVRDERSTNSTYVNGEKVLPGTEKLLTNNCRLVLGDEEFIYRLW